MNSGKIIQIALLGISLQPCIVNAEVWQFLPTVNLVERYNNNITFSSGTEKSVLESQLRSQFSFSRLSETSEVTGRLHANFSSYSKDDEFFTFKSRHKLSELSQWRLKGLFRRDSTTRSVELIQSGELNDAQSDLDDVDDGLVQIEVKRNRLRLEPSVSYKLTEWLAYGMSYKFDGVFYENNRVETGLFGYNQHTVSSFISYEVSRRDSAVLAVGGGRFSAKDNSNTVSDSLSIQVRYRHLLTELMKTELRFGTTKVSSEDDDINYQNYLFKANASYKDRRNRIRLEIGRNIRPSGSGRLVEINNMRLDVGRKFREKLSGLMRVRVSETKKSGLSTENTRYIANLETNFNWNLTLWWSVQAGYVYRIRNEINSTNDAESHSIYALVRYSKQTFF